MPSTFIYVVDRDFGFAPNPFHGYCTLSTCKPRIRNPAAVGDWIIGVGGSRLKSTGKCIYAMKVTEKVTFDVYWMEPRFIDKRPVRNGSNVRMVGDNIYHYCDSKKSWIQADSHHSNPDGSTNFYNLNNDTQSESVLVSEHFFYFGDQAPEIDEAILVKMNFKNSRGHRRYESKDASALTDWIEATFSICLNKVFGDPIDFETCDKRYDVKTDSMK